MSKRKVRNAKISGETRRLQQVEQLRELRGKAEKLEHELKDKKRENLINMCVRNLKIFGGVCNFLLPYVVTAGIGIGAGKLIGFGTPFLIDEIKLHKAYSLEYQLDGQIDYCEKYVFNGIEESGKLILYYPYEKTNDNEYSRKIHKYNLFNAQHPLLYEAILQGNINYIIENFNDYEETIEKINYVPNEIDYDIEASLAYKNLDDVLVYHENEEFNQDYTKLIFYATLTIGTVWNLCRNFKLPRYIKGIWNDYAKEDLTPLKEELSEINHEVMVLTKKVQR